MQPLIFLKKYALYIAFLQAWTATLGSLYFSEIQKLPVCNLCWYQRIFMYPLAIIFAVALIKRDKNISYYGLPLAIIGGFIALYQYLLQMKILPQSADISCDLYIPCDAIDFIFLGFITIPFLSLLAFIVIAAAMVLILKNKKI